MHVMENQGKATNITGANTMTEKTCPSCNGTNVAEIMYGYPSSQFLDEMKKDENKGKFQLGGCCISNDDPAFSCNDCGNLFGNREEEEDA